MTLFLPRRRYKLICLLSLTLFASACRTPSSVHNWPSDLPARSIFVSAYNEQVAKGTNTTRLETHLLWIKRFYKGSIIYPIGWNDMIEMVFDSFTPLQSDDAAIAKKKLKDLGLKISIEWAQDSNKRKINSSNIAVWGSSLRTSVERKEQLSFIKSVEQDVEDLIDGTISMKEISRDRYYPPEDYDNF